MLLKKFIPKEKITQYLNYDEIEYKEWFNNSEIEFIKWMDKSGYYPSSGNIEEDSKITFPNVDDNDYLYQKLIKTKDLKGCFDPLYFFNLLYEKFELLLDLISTRGLNDERIIPFMGLEKLEMKQRYFFLYSLHYIIYRLNSEAPYPEVFGNKRDKKSSALWQISEIAYKMYKKLEKELSIHIPSPKDTEIAKKIHTMQSELLLNTIEVKPALQSIERSLTYKQVAFILVYNNSQDKKFGDRPECEFAKIGMKFGMIAKTTGKKLKQFYSLYIKRAERIDVSLPITAKVINKKINYIKELNNYLTEGGKEESQKDIKWLKDKITSYS